MLSVTESYVKKLKVNTKLSLSKSYCIPVAFKNNHFVTLAAE